MPKDPLFWFDVWFVLTAIALIWLLCTFDSIRETEGRERTCNMALLVLLAVATLKLHKYAENDNLLWCGGALVLLALIQLYRSIEYTPHKAPPENQNPDS